MLHISRFLNKKEVEMVLSSHKISHLTLTQPARRGDVTVEGKKRDMSRKRELLRILLFFFSFHETLSYTLLTLLSLAMFVLIDFGCLKGSQMSTTH